MDAPTGLARTDRQEALHPQCLPPVPDQRAEEEIDVLGRADQQGGGHVGGMGGRQPPAGPLAQPTIGHPRCAEEHQQGQCMDGGECRIGGCHAGQHAQAGEQGGAQRAGAGHGKQIADPGEAPVLRR